MTISGPDSETSVEPFHLLLWHRSIFGSQQLRLSSTYTVLNLKKHVKLDIRQSPVAGRCPWFRV